MKQLIVEIPESYSREHKLRIIEGLEKKYKDVCILETECTELKIHNLNDSFTREMHDALRFKENITSLVMCSPKRSCIALGCNPSITDTYGWELGSIENAVLDFIVQSHEIRNTNTT